MFSKNNRKMLRQQQQSKNYHYAIKRLNIGVASVAVAAFLSMSGYDILGGDVYAQTTDSEEITPFDAYDLETTAINTLTLASPEEQDGDYLSENSENGELSTNRTDEQVGNIEKSQTMLENLQVTSAPSEEGIENKNGLSTNTDAVIVKNEISPVSSSQEKNFNSISLYSSSISDPEITSRGLGTSNEESKSWYHKQNLAVTFDDLTSPNVLNSNEINYKLSVYSTGNILNVFNGAGPNFNIRLAIDDKLAAFVDNIYMKDIVSNEERTLQKVDGTTNIWEIKYSDVLRFGTAAGYGSTGTTGKIVLKDSVSNVLEQIKSSYIGYRAFMVEPKTGVINGLTNQIGIFKTENVPTVPNISSDKDYQNKYRTSGSDAFYNSTAGPYGSIIVDHKMNKNTAFPELKIGNTSTFHIKIDPRLVPYVDHAELHLLPYNVTETDMNKITAYDPKRYRLTINFNDEGHASYDARDYTLFRDRVLNINSEQHPSVIRVVIKMNKKFQNIISKTDNGEYVFENFDGSNIVPIVTYFTAPDGGLVEGTDAYGALASFNFNRILNYKSVTVEPGSKEMIPAPTYLNGEPVGNLDFAVTDEQYKNWVTVNPDGSILLTPASNLAEDDYYIPISYDTASGRATVDVHVIVSNGNAVGDLEILRQVQDETINSIDNLKNLLPEEANNFKTQVTQIITIDDAQQILDRAEQQGAENLLNTKEQAKELIEELEHLNKEQGNEQSLNNYLERIEESETVEEIQQIKSEAIAKYEDGSLIHREPVTAETPNPSDHDKTHSENAEEVYVGEGSVPSYA
ncbi:MAG: YSIRK-type signal peptide-containing protein, partial [Aerococcus sp.]|nr:YSIRK-type signal peptide-containing protein [Aerococcus sp.]